MKIALVACSLLVACGVCYAAEVTEQAPLLVALQPPADVEPVEVAVGEPVIREKRFLGVLGAGAIGAGMIGAGMVGAGAIGAGAIGAGLIGAKAGILGGALAYHALNDRRPYHYGYRRYHYAPYYYDGWY